MAVMEWHDEGIILGTRRHGETSAIAEIMTRRHGRHLGMVRGGRSRRMQPLLQPGNKVELTWRARLDEHLGTYRLEPLDLNAARLLETASGLFALQLLASHLRLLPERDPHESLYRSLDIILGHAGDAPVAAELLLRFELRVLEELGFGLDLSRCAATGTSDELVYVSPKTGRAVCRDAGAPWHDKLLALPAFLRSGSNTRGNLNEYEDAFGLTGFFFARHVHEPRGLAEPEARSGFLNALRKAMVDARGHNGEDAA